MILKFEHRVFWGFTFQKDAYINMDNVFAIEVIRTRIIFRTNQKGYWVPRTEHNMEILDKYMKQKK